MDAPSRMYVSVKEEHEGDLLKAMENLEPLLGSINVGTPYTVFTRGNFSVRYATPSAICERLDHYNKTGRWDLPVGEYVFTPPTEARRG